MAEPRGGGGRMPLHIFSDQLTLFQPGGQIIPPPDFLTYAIPVAGAAGELSAQMYVHDELFRR